jgi:hypothetical protein
MLCRLGLSFFLCVLISGCGGGSAISQSRLLPVPPSGGAQGMGVAVSISIPAVPSNASAIGRRPLYVSANTQSAAISVNGGTPVIANLAASSPNCTAVAGGGRTCTVTISAPVGTDTFAETTYASTNGTGSPLSESTTSETIVAGKANTVNMTLGGVVASIALSLSNPNPRVGQTSTLGVNVNFYDASNAAIIGGDPFANPVTLTNSDTSGATTFSKTVLNSPSDAVGLTLGYTGASISQAVLGASAAGVPAGSVTKATLTPSNSSDFVDWPTYQYDSQRTGFNPSSSAITPASISQIHLGWQISSAGDSQTQPIVATNINGHSAIVIIGGFSGINAYDALSGAKVWQTNLGTQNLQGCGRAPVSGTAYFDRALGAVFMAGGDSGNPSHDILYEVNVATGSVMNKVDLTPNLLPGEALFGHTAVTYANGLLYAGTGSNCEGTNTGLPSWRGRVVAVNPGTMQVVGTFFTTFGQNGVDIGGGGVWAWGGVSADPSGNVYVATGNAETNNAVGMPVPAPFVLTDDEQAGYAEHLVKLTSDLSQVEDSNYPGFNFQIGSNDLDYAGTPVIYTPPLGSGCGQLSATQGKGGTLVINNTQQLTPALNSFAFSVPNGEAFYIGNPGYSPVTGLLYAAVSSSGNGSLMMPPGMAAISGCGSTAKISWTTPFGPDSTAYAPEHPARSAPTVTAGGVVFMATPCTSNGNGGCTTAGKINGAVWAVDAATGALLGGGKPLLVMSDTALMAPSADGLWVYVLDNSGNLYGLTIDASVRAITAKPGRRVQPSFVIRHLH